MKEENINQIIEEALKEIELVDSLNELANIKAKYLSKKSPLTSLLSEMKDLSIEEKKFFGRLFNDAKNKIALKIEEKNAFLIKKEIDLKVESEKIDITLPSEDHEKGVKNSLLKVRDEMINLFLSMGYDIAEGPEVETDHFNFELLNTPKDHPARDMQDSFYITPSLLLRTHTSPVQAHTMCANVNTPIKIICPGKTYRRDDDDATHSHQFMQVEGLVIGKDVSLASLKATLNLVLKRLFGEKREIRFRSSYFPFTEPSVEVDISCANCGGKGCSMCKGTGYIEILGAGMVHPNVLRMCGYDDKVFQGFAFGIGIERVAMLKYGIDDIRRFYQNDIRFIEQFKKEM